MEVLVTMTEGDLKELGVSFGVRRKIKIQLQDRESKTNAPVNQVTDDSMVEEGLHQPPKKVQVTDDSMVEEGLHQPPTKVKKSSNLRYFLLNKNTDGCTLARHLDNGEPVTIKQRRLLVRYSVSYLEEKCGLWPTADEKRKLAKEIVTTWPQLQDNSEGLQGHECYYHDGTGFIQTRLKNIRQTQDERMRNYKKKTPGHGLLNNPGQLPGQQDEQIEVDNDQETLEKVEWLRYAIPTKQTITNIREYFSNTFSFRRAFITGKGTPTITDVLEKFPRFRDVPELINADFAEMFPKQCDQMVKTWGPFFVDRIIALARKDYPVLQEIVSVYENTDGDKDLCGLSLLIAMLHRPTCRRKGEDLSCSRGDALQYLVKNVPVGTNVQGVADRKDTTFSQPYLVMTVGVDKKSHQYFLVLDKSVVQAGDNVVQGFDRLFKAHYVFNVEYAWVLEPFYQLVAAYIYNVLPQSQVRASVRALASTLKNMTM